MSANHPWLGPVADGFRIGRLKHVLSSLKSGGTPESGNPAYWAEDGTPWVAISDMSGTDRVEFTSKSVTDAGIADKRLQILQPGTLLYSMYASLGHVSELAIPATTNQAILGLTFAGFMSRRYAFWQLKALQPYVVETASSNTQDNLNAEKVRNLPFVVPPTDEQHRIANFLDEQTARIDALIAEKERLVQRLDELRDAICRSALTRGLVPKPRFVESGQQFLGAIPAHWKVLPWKRLGYFTGGTGFPIEYQGVMTEELPFFKVKDLDAVDLLQPLTEADNTVSRETATKLRATVFPAGTLTFAKVGAALLLLRVRRLGVPGCLDNNMMAFIPDEAVVDPLFAQLALSLLPLDWLVNPGAVPSVSASQVGEVKVALPALDEQRQIAAYVQSKFVEFAGVRSHLHEHIARLREYRSSLISAAVTGQLDLSTFKAAA